MTQLPCSGRTALFFSGDLFEQDAAKALCSDCSIRKACLTRALEGNEAFGVWGGMTPRERWRYQREQREVRSLRRGRRGHGPEA